MLRNHQTLPVMAPPAVNAASEVDSYPDNGSVTAICQIGGSDHDIADNAVEDQEKKHHCQWPLLENPRERFDDKVDQKKSQCCARHIAFLITTSAILV